MSFENLGLHASLLRAVAAEGYASPTPIQAQSIPHLAEGRDLLGVAQTGTGKTAAFALPILHRLQAARAAQPAADRGAEGTGAHEDRGRSHRGNRGHHGPRRQPKVLVLSPTRELACQIGDSFTTYGRHTGVRHVLIYGGVGQMPQVRALRHGVDIIIATPGRLVDLMNQGLCDLSSIEIFVLDEADRMFDMGFLPDMRRVIDRLPEKRQTVLFSATMPEPIERLAQQILHKPVQVRIAPAKKTTDLIDESLYFVPQKQKSRLLAELLQKEDVLRSIVFTRTKHGADRVAKELNKAGIPADAIHGNKSQNYRQRTLAAFKADKLKVLVATDLAARGIDVDGVTHVFNFDLPQEPETYVHRIGRTGRAGSTGTAIAFCDNEERGLLRSIEQFTRRRMRIEGKLPAGIARVDEGEAPARHRNDENRNRFPAQRGRDEVSTSASGPKTGSRFGRSKGSKGSRVHRAKEQRNMQAAAKVAGVRKWKRKPSANQKPAGAVR